MSHPKSPPRPLEFTVAQLRALAAFAGTDETRQQLMQIWFGKDYVVATNGHRLVHLTLNAVEGRNFGVGAPDIRGWLGGFPPETRVQVDHGKLTVLRQQQIRREGDAPSYIVQGSVAVTRDWGAFPPFEQVMPACVKHGGWPAHTERKIEPHALAVAYLEGMGELAKAFDLPDGVEILDAPGALDAVVYGHRGDPDAHERGGSGVNRLIVLVMPWRIDWATDEYREQQKRRQAQNAKGAPK